ncbi:MAG: rhomboid family intramembrane serine protease [Planctomycetes bacterium]|nr:rhomboid family intramembrane serine protease [Planctomycetota bacterium]
MLLPYTTDCYRDENPYGTIGLVVVNVLVYGAQLGGLLDESAWSSNWSRLDLLDGLRSQLFHGDAWHLAGNMLFLWIFGQIVEGAIGTRAFLLWLLAVALSSTCLEHLAFSAREGGSYGASGLVFACIAGGALLAPKSRIRFVLWLLIPRRYEVGLSAAAVGFLAFELWGVFEHFALRTQDTLPYTPLLHTAGFAIGLGLAYLALKLRLVDAGGWDWLSRRARRERGAMLGDFVAPDVEAGPPAPQSTPPKCAHCGRVRPKHLRRCVYCGKP